MPLKYIPFSENLNFRILAKSIASNIGMFALLVHLLWQELKFYNLDKYKNF